MRQNAQENPEAVFSSIAFLGAPTEVHTTVKGWLRQIHDDSRTHMQVAADLDLDTQHLHPEVWAKAVNQVASCQGWWPESYVQVLDSNAVEHRMNPHIAIYHRLQASSRKSGLLEHADSLVLKSAAAPQDWGDKSVLITEATEKVLCFGSVLQDC